MSRETIAWYQGFLHSDHWIAIKNKIYAKFPYCQICGKRYHLQLHHISYERRGTIDEYKDVRQLCADCHRRCHFILWIFRIPRTTVWLTTRYYYIKSTHAVVQLLKSYRV